MVWNSWLTAVAGNQRLPLPRPPGEPGSWRASINSLGRPRSSQTGARRPRSHRAAPVSSGPGWSGSDLLQNPFVGLFGEAAFWPCPQPCFFFPPRMPARHWHAASQQTLEEHAVWPGLQRSLPPPEARPGPIFEDSRKPEESKSKLRFPSPSLSQLD